MENLDEKSSDVKSNDADADDDDEKTMDDSPTSNDDDDADAEESTSTTPKAATKDTGKFLKYWGQFHESKVESKIPPGGIPLNFYYSFSPFFSVGVNSAKLQSNSLLKT